MAKVQEGASIGNEVAILRMTNEDRIKSIIELQSSKKNHKNEVDRNNSNLLDKKIKQAITAQKIASDLSDKYGYNNKPRKTVASNGTINTLSGWKTLDENSEFTRVSVDDVFRKSNEIGHILRNAGANDQGIPGQYYASHAEKQLSILSNEPIGISQPMCGDCQAYFKKLAIYEGKMYVTADPNTIRIFNPDGTVNEINRQEYINENKYR